ncbi:complex I subunit 1 family protein [Methanoregula sp.]|jgi:NADH-quinone oxidoreductase subunit H|uniref:complex I subunit 1 family protein n=1 Tax=Methanoregula sp. TaxID=2052170 RepID=UPI0025FB11C0|nr:complex I subunit 1 family protein [Methanoregula sp.]
MTDPVSGLIYILIFPGFLFLFLYALFLAFLDRKIAARMQQRVGPPFFQPFADFIKMLGKEVIDPAGVDRVIFDAAPLVALAAVMTAYLYIPIVGNSPLAFQGDLVVVLYLMSLPTIVLFLLGWLSRNIFSAIGGIRSVTQLFIYEVPFFLALMTPALMAGTWSISEIVIWQQKNMWFVFLQPIGFIVALIGLQAKLERTPFDIPEAETEIVAGPWTELTGRRLAIMDLTVDVSFVVGSALIAAVFLGGPLMPWAVTPAWLAVVVGFFLFLAKTLAVLLILSSIKVATGRIRIDQLNDIGWKYIASASIVQVGIVLVMNYLWVYA